MMEWIGREWGAYRILEQIRAGEKGAVYQGLLSIVGTLQFGGAP